MQRRAAFAIAMLSLAIAATGCEGKPTGPAEGPATGQLQLALRAVGSDNATYELRGATIDITGEQTSQVQTGDVIADEVLDVTLTTGRYLARLQNGWVLHRIAAQLSGPVQADLVSDNPIAFVISPGLPTAVRFEFRITDVRVIFQPGTAQIGIVVTVPDAGLACNDAGACRGIGEGCRGSGDCTTGFCADGVCCETACGGRADDCQACAQAMTGRPDGVCAPANSGFACRASRAVCDLAEVCDGTSIICPGDRRQSAGVVCRGAINLCDVPESCTGVSDACPADGVRPAAYVCRPSFFECDREDVCDGRTVFCAERFQPNTRSCGAPVSGMCDAPDHCTGTSANCVAVHLSGVECRATQGACDRPEYCTGSSRECPPDQVVSAGIVCRANTAACDPAESCDGMAARCPTDVRCGSR